MAVINKLRNSKWVLVVILVSLLIFVLTDFLTGDKSIATSTDSVGEIDGTSITLPEFDAKYREMLQQFENNGQFASEEVKQQASMYAWNQFIQTLVIDKEYAKLGIDITPEESGKLLYSDDAHPTIKQYFSQEGVFSPSNVINFRNQVAKKDPKMMEQFELIVKQIALDVKSKKYNSMLNKSIYATSLDAEDDYIANTAEAIGKSLTISFSSIDNKEIEVTDADLKSYLNKNKDKFQQKASRDIEYVMVNITASKADTLEAKYELESMISSFKSTEDDSLFVTLNSSNPFDVYFQSRGSYNKEIEPILFNSPIDSVFGPIFFEGGYSLFKVLDKKNDSVLYYNAIRFEIPVIGGTKKDTLEATAKAKKITAESKNAKNALEFLQNKFNNQEIGPVYDMGWFREGTQPEEINKALKKMSGLDYTTVNSYYGLNMISLNEIPSRQLIKLAQIRKTVEPMSSTLDSLYNRISDFRNQLQGKDGEFDAAIKKYGFTKGIANNIKEDDDLMTGIPSTGDVVKWCYNDKTKKGEYSDVIVSDNFLLVARMAKIKKEGTSDLEDVREKVREFVINEKKAEKIKSKLEEALKTSKNLDEVASKMKVIAYPFQQLNFVSNSIPYTDNDFPLVGYAFGLKLKTLSRPIVGENGVHLLFIEELKKPQMPENLKSRQDILYASQKQQAVSLSFEALKKAAKVQDNRKKYY
ncbi:MAG: SurA N-terminal domain-containing protein [Bacteroidota bacterium]|nr:SurA N-terminal domain-containing protein [Bacteroidota bacterium]